MDNLLSSIKKVDKVSWIINLMILILSLLMIAFINVDAGFITIIILGILNLIYLIVSIIAVAKYQYKKALLLAILNLILTAAAYYVGIILLLEGFY